MHHTSDAEALSRSQYNEPATAGQRWELLSLSWYSSVPEAGAHLTLSRVSAPRAGGGSSLCSRVWLASRRKTAGPRSAWRVASGNGSVVRIRRAEIGPRRKSKRSGLHLGTSFENQGFGVLVAPSGPQDTGSATCGGDTGDAGRFGPFELVEILSQNRLVQEQSRECIHQDATQMDVA